MIQVPASPVGAEAPDIYPSRTVQSGSIQVRRDPVVYAGRHTECPLSERQVQQYRDAGFLELKGLLNTSETELLKGELQMLNRRLHRDDEARISEPGEGNSAIRSIFAIHRSSRVFARLATDSRLVNIARYLLGDEVYIHQSRLNNKPGFRGKEFYWHSDFETWHAEDGMPSMRALSVLVALSANDARNGGLMCIPGSHNFFVPCEGETPENNYLSSLRRQEVGVPSEEHLVALAAEGGVVTADLEPGSVFIFDCNLLHGSNSNITPWPRANVFFVYNAISNRVTDPFCGRAPRPEHVCTRHDVQPISPRYGELYRERA